MIIGYARVSTQKQHLDRQIELLKAEGCERIFAEKASAVSMTNRPELDRAITNLDVGDTIIFAEWDRATRSMIDGIEIMRRIHDKGATLKALDRSSLDLTTPTGAALLNLLSAFAEEERTRIIKRAAAGRKTARKRGTRFGRPSKFPIGTPARSDIEQRLRREESCHSIAQLYSCSHNTIVAIRNAIAFTEHS